MFSFESVFSDLQEALFNILTPNDSISLLNVWNRIYPENQLIPRYLGGNDDFAILDSPLPLNKEYICAASL